MTKAVYSCLEEWGIKDPVQGMSFDTVASNTCLGL